MDATKLGEFIDASLISRTDIKPRTRINFRQVRRDLVARFGEDKLLRDVTPGDTDEWRRWLLTREKNKLGENTVRRHCGRAKQLFRAALRKRLIFALARFGGLWTPSETLLLRWADVGLWFIVAKDMMAGL